LKASIQKHAVNYRSEYAEYYGAHATTESPRLRDSNPSVVIIPGLGLFGFGKNKKEARITTEFFINAIHVMSGANALDAGAVTTSYPQARRAERSREFDSLHNYVALPRSEAFRIEYWALEEAKLQRMPAEAEFSRKIVVVVGGGSGIGREVALLLARKGAHVVVADQNEQAIQAVASEVAALSSPDAVAYTTVDISSSESIAAATKFAVLQFGGIDALINTAAIFAVAGAG
jgi:FlaA1/EpsC-like NDP-sugar epimerase